MKILLQGYEIVLVLHTLAGLTGPNTCSTVDLHPATQQKLAEISHQQTQGYFTVTSRSSCAWHFGRFSLTMCHNYHMLNHSTELTLQAMKARSVRGWEQGKTLCTASDKPLRGQAREQHQVCLTMNSTQALTVCIIPSRVCAVLLMLQLHTYNSNTQRVTRLFFYKMNWSIR